MGDVGRTREEIVSHKPKASDVQAFQVFFQNPAWIIEPLINHVVYCFYITTAFSMWFTGIIINRY